MNDNNQEQSKLQQILNSPESISNTIQNNDDNHNNINNQNNQSPKIVEPRGILVDNGDLLTYYIGKNYEKILSRSFNFAAFFFGPLYMLYRKMFGYSLLYILFFLVLSYFISNPLIYYGIVLLVSLFIGFRFNKMYLSHVRKKLLNLKYEYPTLRLSDLTSICQKKGGTSIVKVFIGVFVHILLVGGIFYALNYFGYQQITNKVINNPIFKIDFKSFDFNNLSNKYNGVTSYNTKIDISEYFDIDIPDGFVTSLSNKYSYEYSLYGSDELDNITGKCNFSFYSIDYYTDDYKYISEIREYEKDNNPTLINTKTINNLNWNTFGYTDEFGENRYYTLSRDNLVFVFKYNIERDEQNECEEYLNRVINSIKSK